jgi:glycine cleavage system regulatory protein
MGHAKQPKLQFEDKKNADRIVCVQVIVASQDKTHILNKTTKLISKRT